MIITFLSGDEGTNGCTVDSKIIAYVTEKSNTNKNTAITLQLGMTKDEYDFYVKQAYTSFKEQWLTSAY